MFGSKGFSLVEVMCITVIICMTSAFSFPAFLSLRSGFEARSAVMELVADLQYAKLEAVKQNHFVAVQFTPDGYQVFVDNGAGGGRAGDWTHSHDEKLIVSKKLEPSLRISSNFPADHLRFIGTSNVRSGTVKVDGGKDRQYNIVLSRVGRVKVIKGL